MPVIGDIVELIMDIPERHLESGMQGTVVHCHDAESYEVEFTNENGETISLLALDSDQFIVVWRAEAHEWVSAAEQVAAIVARLPQETVKEVLDFARFLSMRSHERHIQKSPTASTSK